MATSETQICNSALTKVGADLIISIDDSSRTARYCKQQFDILRDEVLRAHPWNFAKARKQLAKTANTPDFEFDNEFLLPNDCLRVLEVDGNIPQGLSEVDWSIETRPDSDVRVLLTNDDAIKIKYIKRVSTVALYDSNFVEVLSARIAADLAFALVQSSALQTNLFALYERLLKDARSFNAQEGSLKVIEASDWLNSRV